MISQVQSATPQYLQQHQRVRLHPRSSNGIRDSTTAKSRPALISPVSPVYHDTYSASSKSLKNGSKLPAMSTHDQHLFVRSKSNSSQGHISPAVTGSSGYPTVSTLPRFQSTAPRDGSDQPHSTLKTQIHTLPRHGSTSIADSTQRPNKPGSAVTSIDSSNVKPIPVSLSRVDTAETRLRPSAARTVIKSPSRSTIDTSKVSSSSSGALSSRDRHLSSSSSHLDRQETGGHAKRRRTGEDIKLKPIHEVEIGVQRPQNGTSKLPFHPPGLGSNAVISTGVKVPETAVAPTTPSRMKILLHSQTKRLSQILARTSVVVLSPPVQHADRCRSDENDRQANTQSDGRRGSLDVPKDSTLISDSRGVDKHSEERQTSGPYEDGPVQDSIAQETSEEYAVQVEQEHPKFLSLPLYLSDPDRLSGLLRYLSLAEWCSLYNTSKEIRFMISQNDLLREEVLERFLEEVGYCRWCWREPETIPISLTDMFYYLKGTATPMRKYVEVAQRFLSQPTGDDNDALANDVSRLAQATRSYNRLVLRLRAQLAMVEHCDTLSCSDSNSSGSSSPRKSSYYPMPDLAGSTSSFISSSAGRSQRCHNTSSLSDSTSFSSPLYRPNRAALLRVFVPSPQGEWLSDASVLECEAELKRAELTRFMRLGDVVRDIALGDEKGNSGKLIWDGCYLLDLDYTYSSTGDVPRHIPSLALPPSYFHGIIQRGPLNIDPVIRMDVSPWGEEIARNLQLMKDRMVAETPQGLQNVVRWIHRSTFSIRPPSIRSSASSSGRRTVNWAQTGIPIRDSNGQTVHSSWYGSIVIETDGSSECLDELKERCGLGVFPQKAAGRHAKKKERHEGMVWRIMRDRSRPGEIWIKVITSRERLM